MYLSLIKRSKIIQNLINNNCTSESSDLVTAFNFLMKSLQSS